MNLRKDHYRSNVLLCESVACARVKWRHAASTAPASRHAEFPRPFAPSAMSCVYRDALNVSPHAGDRSVPVFCPARERESERVRYTRASLTRTTLNGGSLGSRVDEGRSKMR